MWSYNYNYNYVCVCVCVRRACMRACVPRARMRACVHVHVHRRRRGQGGSWDRVYLKHVVAAQLAARPVVVALHQRLRGVCHQPEALVPIDRHVEVAARHERMPLSLLGLGVGFGVRLTVGVEAGLGVRLTVGVEAGLGVRVGVGLVGGDIQRGRAVPAPRRP